MIIIFTFDFRSHLLYGINNCPKGEVEAKVADFVEVVIRKIKIKDFAHKDSAAFVLLLICFC